MTKKPEVGNNYYFLLFFILDTPDAVLRSTSGRNKIITKKFKPSPQKNPETNTEFAFRELGYKFKV